MGIISNICRNQLLVFALARAWSSPLRLESTPPLIGTSCARLADSAESFQFWPKPRSIYWNPRRLSAKPVPSLSTPSQHESPPPPTLGSTTPPRLWSKPDHSCSEPAPTLVEPALPPVEIASRTRRIFSRNRTTLCRARAAFGRLPPRSRTEPRA